MENPMKKNIFLLPLVLLWATLSATEVGESFTKILAQFQKTTSTIDPRLERASKCFADIEKKFSEGLLKRNSLLTKQLGALCSTITKINHHLENDVLKPRHVRWMLKKISLLGDAATAVDYNEISREERDYVVLILHFVQNFEQSIYPSYADKIGTSFERFIDSYIYNPAEFYGRNWMWTVPATLAGAKWMYDVLKSTKGAKDIKPLNPEDAGHNSGFFQGLNNMYKGLLVLPIASFIVLVNQKDGFVYDAEKLARVNHPVQSVFERTTKNEMVDEHNQQITVIEKKQQFNQALAQNKNQYVIQAIPGLNQGKPGMCGFYAVYHTMCLYGQYCKDSGQDFNLNHLDLNDLVNRAKFEPLLKSWKELIKKHRIADLLISLEFSEEESIRFYHTNAAWINQNDLLIKNNNVITVFRQWCTEMSLNEGFEPLLKEKLNRFVLTQLNKYAKSVIEAKSDQAKTSKTYTNECKAVTKVIKGDISTILDTWRELEIVKLLKLAVPENLNSYETIKTLYARLNLDLETPSAWLDNQEVEWLIKNHIPQLSEEIDRQKKIKDGIIVLPGEVNDQKQLFQSGQPLFIISFSTNIKPDNFKLDPNQSIWTPATGRHVTAVKMDWVNREQAPNSTPVMTIVDSYPVQDTRFANFFHWIYELFTSPIV